MSISSHIRVFLESIIHAIFSLTSIIFLPWVTGNTTLKHVVTDSDVTSESIFLSEWAQAKVDELGSVSMTVCEQAYM